MGCNDVIQYMWFLIYYGCSLGLDDIGQWVMSTCTLVLRVLAFLLLVCFFLSVVLGVASIDGSRVAPASRNGAMSVPAVAGLLGDVVVAGGGIPAGGGGAGGGGSLPRPLMRWTSATSGFVLRRMCELVAMV
jgi:hypothetical protein